jgi:SAM-dependent methyltransferase
LVTGESFNFDPIAAYYDRTRVMPEAGATATVSLLGPELAGRGLCLEIGVGTGLVALPLHRAGVSMVGVDISVEMLWRLVEKAGADAFPVLVGDATELPFPDRLFGSAIASHVLNLVADWRAAVRELLRVVRPGGVLLINLSASQEYEREVTAHFLAEAGRPLPAPRSDLERLDDELASQGTRRRDLPMIEVPYRRSVEERIGMMERREMVAVWEIPDEVRALAAAATREWARGRYGDIEAPRDVVWSTRWTAYDLA